MKPKRSRDTAMRPKDWALLAVGLAVVVALAAFALTRSSRSTTAAPESTAVRPTEAAPQAEDHDHGVEASVRRINVAELRSAIERGGAVVVDVRDMDSYTAGHIPGSMHIPLSFIEGQVQYLPRDKTIVAYCT